MGPRAKPASVTEYLDALSADKRAALEKLRRTIRAALPGAEECISFQMPAFRYQGKVLVWFGAATNHCSFCPGGVVDALKDELEGYDVSKGTVRFQPDKPLPATLVRKLVKARIAASAARPTRGARRSPGSRGKR